MQLLTKHINYKFKLFDDNYNDKDDTKLRS